MGPRRDARALSAGPGGRGAPRVTPRSRLSPPRAASRCAVHLFLTGLHEVFITGLSEDGVICLSFVASIFPSLSFVFQFPPGGFALWFRPVSSCLEKPCPAQGRGKFSVFLLHCYDFLSEIMFNPTIISP